MLTPCCRIWLYITILLTVACWPGKAWSQNGYGWVTYGPKNGLASAEILTLFQDNHNYLWIGHAAGVSRYDGYAFNNLIPVEQDRVGKTYSITEDPQHLIWIGADRGLFYYDGQQLHPIRFSTFFPVYHVMADTANGLWLSTSEGPAWIPPTVVTAMRNGQTITLQEHLLPAWKKHFPNKHIVKMMAEDPEGGVYLCDGYTIYHYQQQQLHRFWTSSAVHSDYVTGMVAVGKDTLYVSTIMSGLHAINKNRDTLVIPSFTTGNGNHLVRHRQQLYFYATKGVYQFNPSTGITVPVVTVPSKYRDWGSCVWIDAENNYWIGTHEQLLLARRNFFTQLTDPALEGFDELFSVYKLRNGQVLAGSNHGVVFQQSAPGAPFRFWKKVFDNAEVEAIYEYPDGALLFTSGYRGICLLYNNTSRHYTVKEGLRDNTNRYLMTTRTGRVFIAGDNGVSEVIKQNDHTLQFRNAIFNTGSTDYAIFNSGMERPNGQLFFGGGHGLFEWKQDSLVPVQIQNMGRKKLLITDLETDAFGNAWISTAGDGILLCTFNDQLQPVLEKQFTEEDGLHSMVCLRLMIDQQQAVWAADHSGVTRIVKKTDNSWSLQRFAQAQGYIPDDYYAVKMMQEANGTIWMATSSGLVHFDPASATQFRDVPRVVFTNIEQEDRHLSASFSAIHLSDAAGIRYSYRLLGADTAWANAGSERSVTFRYLAPGKYTLEVRAAAGGNQWSAIAPFSFTIRPPFWWRWWFIVIVSLAATALIYYLIRRREKMIREKEAQKTELQKLKAISFQYQLEIEQVTNYFATSMSEQRTVDDMLWDLARNCISKLGFEDCVIYLVDPHRKVLLQKAAWGPKTTGHNKIVDPIEIPLGKGIVGSVAVTGKPEIITDTSIDSRYIIDDSRRYSELSVPVINHGKVIGVIDSEHSQKNFYTARHLQILTTIAGLLADKLDKIRAEQEVREREIEVITLNRDLATSQLTALRAQMNPHFIFNALNSVQQYMLQGNVEEANRYLSKFSRLQREILNHCDQNFITLEKEIDMLQLYLELEQLRFGDSFNYSIELNAHVDSNEIRIPPMILQPFVENAIWHGLMPKNGHRNVQINFSLQEEHLLACTIRDNGIGRAAAAKLKQESGATGHQSKGLRLVYERLAILEQQYQQPFKATIADLTHINGEVAGTEVQLLLYIF